jgi:transcriptional regulator with XRE-family HTH domain
MEKIGINTQWFKGKLADLNLSQSEFADKLSIDPAGVSLMLRGRRKIRIDEAGVIAKILSVPVEDILRHAGVETEVIQDHMTPVVGWLDVDGKVHSEGVEGAKFVPRPAELDFTGQALRYQCDGALDGALVYFHPGEGVEPTSIGRLAIVETKDGQRLLRTIKRGYDRGVFSATTLGSNSKTPDQLALVSAYPVQWMRF